MEIVFSKYLISSPSISYCPAADRPEIAFIGRSNVGKSSLINMICNYANLAKISSAPGKTQMINHFEIVNEDKKNWYLVDLPGFGFAKVSIKQRKKWEKMIEDYLRNRENLVNIFILIDSRHEPQQIDLDFINKMGEWQVPFALVFTKTDKTTQSIVSKNIKDFFSEMKKNWDELPPYFVTSSVKRTGRRELLEFIGKICSSDES
jgi:GTP-binding protein